MNVGAEMQVMGDHQMTGLVVETQLGEVVIMRHQVNISLFAVVLDFSMLENHPFVEENQ